MRRDVQNRQIKKVLDPLQLPPPIHLLETSRGKSLPSLNGAKNLHPIPASMQRVGWLTSQRAGKR